MKNFQDKHWPSPRPKGLSLKEGTWFFNDVIELPVFYEDDEKEPRGAELYLEPGRIGGPNPKTP